MTFFVLKAILRQPGKISTKWLGQDRRKEHRRGWGQGAQRLRRAGFHGEGATFSTDFHLPSPHQRQMEQHIVKSVVFSAVGIKLKNKPNI